MKTKRISILLVTISLIASCAGIKSPSAEHKNIGENRVLSKAEQTKLSADEVIEILKQGNKDFVNNQLTLKNNPERIKSAVSGQYPEAIILSCIDSRVPVEDVFHRAIGDVFVARVAGNIVNPDILASMEYACKVSGSKLIVVLGHESCGAVKAAIDDVKLGNITELLGKITPVVDLAKIDFRGITNSSNNLFVEKVSRSNVNYVITEIRENSTILKQMEENGEIKIVGAMYHLENGKVDFLEGI